MIKVTSHGTLETVNVMLTQIEIETGVNKWQTRGLKQSFQQQLGQNNCELV